MAVILDIAGNPMPPRKRRRNPAREQDIRDLSKILVMLVLIVMGYFMFAPETAANRDETKVAATRQASG